MKKSALLACYLLWAAFLSAQAEEVHPLGVWDSDTVPVSVIGEKYNDCWGFVHNGVEYGVIGSTLGTHIIDINTMQQVAFVKGSSYGTGIIHRDFKTYDHYLYAVSDENADGTATLQVIDFSYLPDSVHVTYDSYQYMNRAHDCWVDTSRAKLYTCGVRKIANGGGWASFQIFDLAPDPAHPVWLRDANNFADGQSIPYIHDLYVRNDTAFLNCGFDGLYVADCSNPDSIILLGTMTDYPQKGYNHSGWWDVAGQYYYMADETHGMDLKVVQTDDLTDLSVVATFNSESPASTRIPHNLIWREDVVYVSYYYDGYQAFDVRDPLHPKRVAYYDTYAGPDGQGYEGAWGVYPLLPSGRVLISDMLSGLFVFPPVQLPVATREPLRPAGKLTLVPNPARLGEEVEIVFRTFRPDRFTLLVTDVSGRAVYQKRLDLAPGRHRLRIEGTSKWPPGMYIVRLASDGRVLRARWVRQ